MASEPRTAPPVWDLSRVEGRLLTVASSRVVDLLRVSHDPETIAAYREAMARGEAFPPVAVVLVLARPVIADGHRRFQAATALGTAELPVEVWTWRRLAADLLEQGRATRWRLGRAVTGLGRGREGRAETRAFVAHELRHLHRIAASLLALLRGR